MRWYFIAGIAALIANEALELLDIGETFWSGFLKGATAGLSLCAMIFGVLYVSGCLTKAASAKERIFRSPVEKKSE